MVVRRRKYKAESAPLDALAAEGVEQITRENADEQFSKLLGVLDRIDDTIFSTVVEMRKNRKVIDADLEQIARNNEEIAALIRGLQVNG